MHSKCCLKPICFLLGMLLCTPCVYSQDILTQRNSDGEEVNVIKITSNEIEYKTYKESNSPVSKKYIIAYSLDPEFKSKKVTHFSVCLKDAIGCRVRPDRHTLIVDGLKNFGMNTIRVGGMREK